MDVLEELPTLPEVGDMADGIDEQGNASMNALLYDGRHVVVCVVDGLWIAKVYADTQSLQEDELTSRFASTLTEGSEAQDVAAWVRLTVAAC